MAITENDIILCGHGSGTPSTKNMKTYLTQRYNSVAPNKKRKGVVCVLRLKALDDAGRTKFANKYATILGRNKYNQNLRSYVYTPYEGVYYSDCSSSICGTFKAIGYAISLLNTAGMYYSSLFEKVNVKISDGHITNPEVLKIGDCIMFVGNDPSRPLQIGHVEAVYKINGQTSTSSTTASTTTTTSSSDENTNVKKGQAWLNDNYGHTLESYCGEELEEDGDYGPKTRKACVCVWKDVVNRKYNFSLTPSNSNFFESCKKAAKKARIENGASGTFVLIAQLILSAKGFYTGKMDAKFGSAMDEAVRKFQDVRGLEVDGIIGADTWYALFN